MPDDKKDPESPATTSLAYDAMLPMWAKIDSVLGGTETMRDAGTEYLPQHAEENEDVYDERLATAVFFNITQLTIESWVGRPFSDPVILSDEVPENVTEWLGDIDMQGNNIDVFARNWFERGLSKAFAHILVDFPRPRDVEAEEGRPRTLADDRKEGLRPYWVMVDPENVIFASAEIVDGKEVLTHVRIHETVAKMVGFAEIFVEQIKVYDAGTLLEDGTIGPTHVRLFERIPEDQRRKGEPEWRLEDEWDLGISFIPLVTFYADRIDFMFGKPPPIDLANLNIQHWQSEADQFQTLTVARFPILAVSGAVDDKGLLKVGPRKWLHVPDPQGKYYYVEHNGKAIAAGRQHALDLEERMAEYGAEFLKKRPGDQTATARALDSAEATSPLQDATIRFTDAVNQALMFTAAWAKIENPGEVSISTEFGPEEVETADFTALGAARKGRDLSRAKYLQELHRRGLLNDEFDFAENERELDEESAAFAMPVEPIDEGAEEDGDEEEEIEETT